MRMPTRLTRRDFLKVSALGAGAAALAACAPAAAAPTPAPTLPGKTLEIFSWWTSGGETDALNALYAVFKKQYPGVQIINTAMAGGAASGGNMKSVLETRMLGGDPPDSFQVHLGGELFDPYVVNSLMEPLDFLYDQEGYAKVFPKSLVEIASYKGSPYSVPVDIHRANMLWYNTRILGDLGAKAPATWDDFFSLAESLRAKNIPALGVGESTAGFWAQVSETILIANLGAEGYRGLFNGKTKWDSDKVTAALQTSLKALDYANPDYLSVAAADVSGLLASGKVAMFISGDWIPGDLWSRKFADFGWAPAPGNTGVYDMLSDSFGLPKGAKNRENTVAWLKVCGSKEGQEAFNPLKGSISARTDANSAIYSDQYHPTAMKDWAGNEIVPSIVHGAAARLSYMDEYMTILHNLAAKKQSVVDAQAALVKAAQGAHFDAAQ